MTLHRFPIALILCLLLPFSFQSYALQDAGEAVNKRGAVEDDYYAAGGTVDIDAQVDGDLTAVGGNMFIGRGIQGDVMAAGGSVNIQGDIKDDVRTAGGDISIDALIGDDLLATGGSIRVSPNSRIGGNAWLAGGDVNMGGTIDKDLSIGAGQIRISGTVHGDVELNGGQIHILDGARIDGDLTYSSSHPAIIDPGAQISGLVTFTEAEWEWQDQQPGYGMFFVITMIIASVVLLLIFPRYTLLSAERARSDPWKSLGVGFVFLILTPLLAFLLMGVMLGVWIGLTILAFYFVALLLGLLIAFFFVGDWGARLFNRDISTRGRRILSVIVAIILLGFIELIPLIGGVMIFVLLLLGLGASMLQLHYSYHHSRLGE